MRVEIITTGTELLLGEILNTNVQYLSRRLNNMGFDVLYHSTVGDNQVRMEHVLNIARERADIIITSGGLGPTRGDITKDAVMSVCGIDGYLEPKIIRRIDTYFKKKGTRKSSNNDKQAYVPCGAQILPNDVGTAPGLWLENGQNLFIMLPGPPSELCDICEKYLWQRLYQRFGDNGIILSRTLRTRGIGESLLAEKLDQLILAQQNPTIALYARRGEVIVRLTAKAENAKVAGVLLQKCEADVRRFIGDYIYGVDDDTLAACLGQQLLSQKKTIAFAESCSGGLASSLVTDIPGSSQYLMGSIVAYTNMAKMKVLGVAEKTLERCGAVSRQTACEMAEGVRTLLGSDYGVSITGNAGPDASEGKPVGLVFIAVACSEATECYEYCFTSARVENKLRIANAALSAVLDKLLLLNS